MRTKRGISRRKFLIGSAASGAALLAAPYLKPNSWASKQNVSETVKVTPTLCDGCGNWCAIDVYTRGDRVWKAVGNPIAREQRGANLRQGPRVCCMRPIIQIASSPPSKEWGRTSSNQFPGNRRTKKSAKRSARSKTSTELSPSSGSTIPRVSRRWHSVL